MIYHHSHLNRAIAYRDSWKVLCGTVFMYSMQDSLIREGFPWKMQRSIVKSHNIQTIKYLLGDSMMNKLPYDLQKKFRQSEIRIQIPWLLLKKKLFMHCKICLHERGEYFPFLRRPVKYIDFLSLSFYNTFHFTYLTSDYQIYIPFYIIL